MSIYTYDIVNSNYGGNGGGGESVNLCSIKASENIAPPWKNNRRRYCKMLTGSIGW